MENAVNRSQFTSREEVGETGRTPLCSNSCLFAKKLQPVVQALVAICLNVGDNCVTEIPRNRLTRARSYLKPRKVEG